MSELSIVVPVFNEEKNIEPLYSQLKPALDGLGRPYEMIFVDDGSTDSSFSVLKALSGRDKAVRVVRFRRNYGQTAALSAGFKHATGDILITLDGDLQNDPKDIPALLNKMKEGYDIVSGWRKHRKDPFFTKTVPSTIANGLISVITGVYLHDYGCTLKAYKKEALANINLYGEMHRFIPALASWNGVSIAEMPVEHHPRLYGKTKYGLARIGRVLLDLITVKFFLSFSTKPIRFFGGMGFILLLLGSISGLAVIIMKIMHIYNMTGNPLLYLGIMFFIVGVQFIMLGLLGEIIIRGYHEDQGYTTYAVKEII